MKENPKVITIFLFLILGLFLYGIVMLLTMRFEKGDVYPVYSSLRTDPLGTKVFYESLNMLKGISTRRNYRAFSQVDDYQQAAIFYLGAHSGSIQHMDREDAERLERMIAQGSRFVVLLYPHYTSTYEETTYNTKKTKDKREIKDGKDSDDSNDKDDRKSDENRCGYIRCPVSLLDRWGVHISMQEQFEGREYAQRDSSGSVPGNLPRSVSWNSSLYFDKVNESWTRVYILKEQPVLIERAYGRGTIVIATDSYLVSNEALLKERYPQLLSWFVGNNDTVVFDETHFGIRENPGIAALARKYRLHGLFASTLVLGILFIWKNSLSLVPARHASSTEKEDNLLVGKDHGAGFVSLLRKNIASHDLLSVCFREWKRSFHQRQKVGEEDLKHVQAIIESHAKQTTKKRDLVQDYQKINKILGERKLQ